MTDELDQQQESEERLRAQVARPRPRICVRCGFNMPEDVLRQDPDALDCAMSCGRYA